jgi:hypothetical protein
MPRQEPRVNDPEPVQRWLQLSDQADDVFMVWHRLKNKQLAETFWTWYMRLIRERSAIGLDVDLVWKIWR